MNINIIAETQQKSSGISEIKGKISKNDRVIFMNRESNRKQRGQHKTKEYHLRQAHKELGLTTLFEMERFTGSGIYGSDAAVPYFRWLITLIEAGFMNIDIAANGFANADFSDTSRSDTSRNGKLYIVTATPCRLLRASGYSYTAKTWDITEQDWNDFRALLYQRFGQRADDIVFVFLFQDTAAQEREFERQLSLTLTKNRPAHRPQSERNKALKDYVFCQLDSGRKQADTYKELKGKVPKSSFYRWASQYRRKTLTNVNIGKKLRLD